MNNLISLGYAALYSEALVMAGKAGLSTQSFDKLVRSSRMHCAFYETFMGWARDGDANTHRFALDTALHTISDVMGLSQSLGLRGGVTSAVHAVYRDAVATGQGGAMLPELPRFVANASGVELHPARQQSQS